jgi:hypothetical protein
MAKKRKTLHHRLAVLQADLLQKIFMDPHADSQIMNLARSLMANSMNMQACLDPETGEPPIRRRKP